jgi:uncharacterized protein (TIGR02996 family)
VTHHPDLLHLLSGCRADPDSDAPRLVLADYLDEQAQANPVRVACPKCSGSGWKYAGPTGEPRCPDCGNSMQNKTPHGAPSRKRCAHCKLVWTPPKCHPCDAVGAVLDTDFADRAELIRVGCELASIACETPSIGAVIEGKPAPCYQCRPRNGRDCVPWCAPCQRRDEFLARKSALLAAHPDWKPLCPVCQGKGWTPSPDPAGGSELKNECGHCSGTGRVGTFSRGLLSVPVPSLRTIWEREQMPTYRAISNIYCPHCKEGKLIERSDIQDVRDGINPKWCPLCWTVHLAEHSGFRDGDWKLTPWAVTLRDGFPWVAEVPVADRVPSDWQNVGEPSWVWTVRTSNQIETSGDVPRSLFDLLTRGTPNRDDPPWVMYYDTAAAANTALARAVALALFAPGQSSE